MHDRRGFFSTPIRRRNLRDDPNPSADGAGMWALRDPPARPACNPVLLFHGVGCNAGVWTWLCRASLPRSTVPSTRCPMARRKLRSTLRRSARHEDRAIRAATGAARVTLVTHSMGGLVARAYLRPRFRPRASSSQSARHTRAACTPLSSRDVAWRSYDLEAHGSQSSTGAKAPARRLGLCRSGRGTTRWWRPRCARDPRRQERPFSESHITR